MESGSGGGTSASLETHQKANVWPGELQDPTKARSPASLETIRHRHGEEWFGGSGRKPNDQRTAHAERRKHTQKGTACGSRLFLSRELAVSQSERSFWRGTRPSIKQAFPLKARRSSSSVCGKGSLCQLILNSSKVWKTQHHLTRSRTAGFNGLLTSVIALLWIIEWIEGRRTIGCWAWHDLQQPKEASPVGHMPVATSLRRFLSEPSPLGVLLWLHEERSSRVFSLSQTCPWWTDEGTGESTPWSLFAMLASQSCEGALSFLTLFISLMGLKPAEACQVSVL